MEHNMRLQFSSSLENISDVNESFSSGVLKICYTGANRNGSFLSKSSIERALPTMFNCPVVCNYDVESDTIGGHDMDIVYTDDGRAKLVNLTDAVGVIPAGANTWWSVSEDDGVEHEYLMTEAILWKRQPAFSKIETDGIVSQSMEINVKNGSMSDGVFVIDDFTFTAFCLLGEDVAPCFESASLQMFERDSVSQQFADMMKEFKETFTMLQPQKEVVIEMMKGGDEVLEQKIALMEEFGFNAEMLEFDLEEISLEDLRVKFEEMKTAQEEAAKAAFALAEQFREELMEALRVETVETCFGEMARYNYVDYDSESMEVYCYDMNDWKLYGFSFAKNGDAVSVDFDSKKRKKFSIVDFEEGEQHSAFASVFEFATKSFGDNDAQWTQRYQTASETISTMETELTELRQYKADIESAAQMEHRNEVLSQFEDLNGIEEFESLKEVCGEYDLDTLEEKCYALRGKHGVQMSFSQTPKTPKLKVEQTGYVKNDEPYNGVFVKYGIN